jgi:hypothetical protein
MRKTRIDEFQFLNVLKEIWLLYRGPSVLFVKEISEIMPFYERHVIKPDLPVAQVNYSYGASIDDID